PWPSSATPRSTAPRGDRGSHDYWSADTQRWLRLHSPTRWRGWPGPSWSVVRDTRSRSCCWQREDVSRSIGNTNWRGHDDVMQRRSFRGSGEPVWVNALSSARLRLGPDPRRALGPAATCAAPTGRTRDRTRPMLQNVRKFLPGHRPHVTQSGHAAPFWLIMKQAIRLGLCAAHEEAFLDDLTVPNRV